MDLKQLISCFLILLFCACSERKISSHPPIPQVTDYLPIINSIKKQVEVVENGKKFSVYPSEFEWCPTIIDGIECWKIEGRECYTVDFHGYSTVKAYLKEKYPAMGWANRTLKKIKNQLMKISVGQTKCKVWKILGGDADFFEVYDWGTVWFYKYDNEKLMPIVFDNLQRVVGYGSKFYDVTKRELGN